MDVLRRQFPFYDADTLEALLEVYKTPDAVIDILTPPQPPANPVEPVQPDSQRKNYEEILKATIREQMNEMLDKEKLQLLKEMLRRYPDIEEWLRQEIRSIEARAAPATNFQETANTYILHFPRLNATFHVQKVEREWLQHIAAAVQAAPDLSFANIDNFLSMVISTKKEPKDWVERLVIVGHNRDPANRLPQGSQYLTSIARALSLFFPNVATRQFWRFLSETRRLKDIIETVRQCQTIPSMTRPRKQPAFVIIDSPLVSLDLLEMFDQEQTIVAQEEKQREDERIFKEAKESGALIECECCMDEYPFEKLVQCPEGHLICVNCVQKQVATAVTEGKSEIPCAHMGGCECQIPMSELERTMPRALLEQLVQSETMNAIIAADIKGLVRCHKCGLCVVYEEDAPMVCPDCGAKTCPKCSEPWHEGMTCEQFKKIDKQRYVEEQMNEAVVRTCPKCRTQFMKEEGCNKMECPRCHTWICYLCHQVIPKSVGYDHFYRGPGIAPPDKCPLWVDNNVLHTAEANVVKQDAAE